MEKSLQFYVVVIKNRDKREEAMVLVALELLPKRGSVEYCWRSEGSRLIVNVCRIEPLLLSSLKVFPREMTDESQMGI